MRLIKSSFEIIPQQPQEKDLLKHIELCGRCAYKSEDRITEDSYIKFIDMLKGVNHGSVLEHGTVYLHMKGGEASENLQGYYKNKYSVVKRIEEDFIITDLYITTNYRVLVENNWLDDLKYQCEPTEFHEKRYTVRFICDKSVSHEFVRHRTFSFTQESTRYCNYSKNKFENQITYIAPEWLIDWDVEAINKGDWSNCDEDAKQWADCLKMCEDTYNFLINCPNKWQPQQARSILPNALKTELIMTGFISDWKHFFLLRDAESAHPQARELAQPLHQEFLKLNLL